MQQEGTQAPVDETSITEEESRTRVLDLSTVVEPTLLIGIDDVEYELRTLEHLTPVDEARLRALFAKEERYTEQLAGIPPTEEKRLEAVVVQLRKIRIDLIELMSTIPRGTIEKLNVVFQQRIVALIGGRV